MQIFKNKILEKSIKMERVQNKIIIKSQVSPNNHKKIYKEVTN